MPNLTIQILTFTMGTQVASADPVSLLRLPDDQLSDVIYLEQLAMASYLDATGEGHRYRHALDLLSIQATSTSQTQDLLTRILHQPDQPRRHTRAAIPRTARPRKRDSPVQPGRPPLRNRPDQRTCQRDAGPARALRQGGAHSHKARQQAGPDSQDPRSRSQE